MGAVALKVMLSSVRRGGLGPVRDAVAPVLKILRYEPLRFEDVTNQPVPPRAVCIELVERSDIYLLLLGAEYGDVMPDTGLAPTEEEWTIARNAGTPVVVFRQSGVTPEPRQAEFIATTEAYATGVFRGTFTDAADLLGKLEDALATAAASIQPMRPRALAEQVAVPWREDDRRFGGSGVVLETHVVPIGRIDRLSATTLRELPTRLARAGRDHGLFREGQALNLDTTEHAAVAQTDRGDRAVSGVAISAERSVTAWSALPTQQLGAVYDEAQIAVQIARDVRLAASLALVPSEDVAIAAGIGPIDMLGRVTGPNSMTFPFMGSGRGAARIEPTEAYSMTSLARIAPEIGAELAARLTLRLEQRPS
jgi:hypothetical protein